jgi:hypothetical protein
LAFCVVVIVVESTAVETAGADVGGKVVAVTFGIVRTEITAINWRKRIILSFANTLVSGVVESSVTAVGCRGDWCVLIEAFAEVSRVNIITNITANIWSRRISSIL